MSDTKDRLVADMKAAMKAREKDRLATIRMALAAIKQREIDSQEALTEPAVIAVLDKMVKQRRESAQQYDDGGREDLAAKERAEIDVLSDYLPQPLTEAEIDRLIDEAVDSTGAESMQDMGKVMNALRPQLQGRADMQQVSQKVRSRLGA